MRRKLVQLGKHCLMSAIPSKWLKRQGLAKGDMIEFEEIEHYLLVSAKPFPKNKEISIKLEDGQRVSIGRIMQLIYDAGFKKVNISFSEPKVLGKILYSVNWLNGWKIISSSKNACVIDSVESTTFDFDNHFRKVFLNALELPKLITEYLEKGTENLVEEIRVTYQLTYRGAMEVKRRINTSLLPLEYKYYYFIAIQFEELADQYEYLLRYLEMGQRPRHLIKLSKKLEGLLQSAYDNFYRFDINNYTSVTKDTIWRWFDTSKDPHLVFHLRSISERIKNILKYTIGIRLEKETKSFKEKRKKL